MKNHIQSSSCLFRTALFVCSESDTFLMNCTTLPLHHVVRYIESPVLFFDILRHLFCTYLIATHTPITPPSVFPNRSSSSAIPHFFLPEDCIQTCSEGDEQPVEDKNYVCQLHNLLQFPWQQAKENAEQNASCNYRRDSLLGDCLRAI